jgi:transposase-like protein
MPNPWPDEVKDRAVQLYLDGKTYRQITSITAAESPNGRGVPQATVIYWLHDRGIKRRRKPVTLDANVDVDQLLQRLAAAERENGRLEAEISFLRRDNDRLRNATRVGPRGNGGKHDS